MKKFKFIAQYIANAELTTDEMVIEVRAWTYEGAVRKALYAAHKVVRTLDAQGVYTFMRLCKAK
jgi:hypothetical protein